MIKKLNGRLVFAYESPKKISYRLRRPKMRLSLLAILIGIFLLPNLAYLAAITPENLISLTNQERQAQGLNVLSANELLTQAALNKGRAILNSQNFSHTINDKKFSGWVRDIGYDYSYVGENLAIDFATSEGVVKAWNDSPLHKKNLLSPYYSEIGIAAINGKFQGQDTTIVVQIFGAPKSLAGLNFPNTDLLTPQLNSSVAQFGSTKNIIIQPNLSQGLSPIKNIFVLGDSDMLTGQANKFIIQPERLSILENLIIAFALCLTLLFLGALIKRYPAGINKLISI